jgi:multidrug transporter EmrE-like cation transporter
LNRPAVNSQETEAARRRSVLLVLGCTVLGAAAQIFMKLGANHLARPGLLGMATNLPLLSGLVLYGLSTVLLVMALKDGELSLLYPVIALTYVWVTVLSLVLLHDKPDPYKLTGIAIIVIGVSVLGRGGKK